MKMKIVPKWKLRRIATRAVRVLDVHRAQFHALAHFEETLKPAAARFVVLYDASRQLPVSSRERHDAHGAVATLATKTRSWLGAMQRDIPSFDVRSFEDRRAVPDDIIGGAQRLVGIARDFVGNDGKPLAYLQALLADIGPAIEDAHGKWGTVQERLSAEQAMLRETSEAAVVLHRELVAFRRTLRVLLGSSHRDYQVLRTWRASRDGDEDVEVVETTTPAAPTGVAKLVA